MKYECPLCGSPLSEKHYHRVVRSQTRERQAQADKLDKFQKAAYSERRRREKAEAKARGARKEGVLAERKKSSGRLKHQDDQIRRLKEANRMLRTHTSPQELGLADEGVLAKKLAQEFPADRIEHPGKGGDVLQFVVFRAKEVGCVVYECKRTPRISSRHVRQTALAKKTREAAYAILVTTGTRRGFGGLGQDSGILLVAPSGVLTLAAMLRESLIEMAKQRLDAAAREAMAKRLMAYVTSPICKTPLTEAISHTERAFENLEREMKQHRKDWEARYDTYQTIHYDVSHIKNNIARVLNGDSPSKLEKPTFAPLALPVK